MDILKLLAQARAAGLTVRLDGDQVKVEGPKSAEPIVHRMMQAKPAVVEALRHQQRLGRLWDLLTPGERRILDTVTRREWSEYADGGMQVWREFYSEN